MITRRRALAGFLAAPAIVRAESIMRVRVPPLVMADDLLEFDLTTAEQRLSFNWAAYRYLMKLPARVDFSRFT